MSLKKQKWYKTEGKCNDQQQYKAITEAEIMLAPEGCTYNSPMTRIQYEPTKNPSARKSLCKVSEASNVKDKTAVCRLDAANEKRKSIITDNVFWSNTAKRSGNKK